MKAKTFKTEEEFVNETVALINELAPKTIALSGGSTPGPIYKYLDLNAEYFQVDERYVPADHTDSNQKMISETLGKPFHHFDTSLSIDEALLKYADELPPSFDLCILGVGPDAHTASIFPDTPKLTEPVAHTLAPAEFAIKDRLTLTFPTILASKHILVLLKNKPEDLLQKGPAAKLLEHKNLTVHNLSLHDDSSNK